MQYHQSAEVQREKLNLGRGVLIVFAILLILGVSASSPVMSQSPSDKVEGTDALAAQASSDAETAGTTTVYLPLISKSTVAFNSDEEKPPLLLARQQNTDHVGNSPVSPPVADHYTFVTDTGGWLDQYLGRADLPNGLLTFTIGVNGPVLRPDQVGAEGFPTLPAFLQLMEDKTLPRFAQLILQVWDIDDELSLACPQIDHVYVNGQQPENLQRNTPAVLRGGNGQWNTWSIAFPAHLLKYPTAPGQNGQPPAPVLNEIAIAVDTACNPPHWKVEVDWGVISLGANQKYPILFVHGWTGSEGTFKEFNDFARDSGISSKLLDMDGGIEDLFFTSTALKDLLVAALKEFNTTKVNILTHSRGGIFTRHMLRIYPEMAESVANYVTISTPHHGVEAPANWLSNNYDWTLIGYLIDSCNRFSGEDEAKCEVAAEQLTKERMRAYNYGKCKQYVVFMANWFYLQWQPCFPEWTHGGSTEATVTSYTINGGPLDVESTSATFP